jgi:hypothetical protein
MLGCWRCVAFLAIASTHKSPTPLLIGGDLLFRRMQDVNNSSTANNKLDLLLVWTFFAIAVSADIFGFLLWCRCVRNVVEDLHISNVNNVGGIDRHFIKVPRTSKRLICACPIEISEYIEIVRTPVCPFGARLPY